MDPSSALCRAQEAHHRQRATETPLDNVRIVATKAALAWGLEAVAAERRETRQDKVRLFRAAATAQPDPDPAISPWPNENPDRGRAAPARLPA